MLSALPLALVIALAADGALSRDGTEPPAGTPEDRQLWSELASSTADAFASVGRVNQGAFRVRYANYDDELAARGTSAALAGEAAALRERVTAAMAAALAAIPPDGGRIRPCRYALLHLEQRMDELGDPAVAVEMPKFRAEARDCATRMRALVAAVAPRADALEEALAEADAFIARVTPARAAGGDDARSRPKTAELHESDGKEAR